MSDNNSNNGSSIVTGLFGVAFVVLKLTHVIDWSWWWVTLPFWGGAFVTLFIFLVIAIAAAAWPSNR